MFRVLGEQENYLLVSNGDSYAVVERRAGRYYALRNRNREGLPLDDRGVAQLIRRSGTADEVEARDLLASVATQWRDLCEHVR
ncbi:conserved protein of unknown function [Rhodovastum atsumiense]|uniref:Uncharacterized protein n=1 Tax=Rhodovastum atsumiense TaxID=504468 RepID=A0A5M6ITM2_9PROT|nr:hypothetical protein [Rhodovastum atsumiense]KAA5611673.1 hypothetical protein F1189_12805 [Rhodovastum atsumiense]CAH2604246.1 conserved protein of unknown function [Rhodovastum atsumiense]